MFIEFAHWLTDSVKELVSENPELGNVFAPNCLDRAIVEIEEYPERCPVTVEGFFPIVSSGVAFRLAAQFRSNSRSLESSQNGFADPDYVAAKLVSIFYRKCPDFRLVVGGQGFINAAPTDGFLSTFYRAITVGGPEIMFSINPIVEMSSSYSNGDAATRDYTPVLSSVGAIACAEPELIPILEQVDLDPQLWWTICAYLGASEISVTPCRKGFQCSENVGWYLGFALDKIAKALEPLSADLGLEKNSLVGYWDVCSATNDQGNIFLRSSITETLKILFRLRYAIVFNQEPRRSIVYTEQMLGVARSFFRWYNFPGARAKISHSLPRIDRNLAGSNLPVSNIAVSNLVVAYLRLAEKLLSTTSKVTLQLS